MSERTPDTFYELIRTLYSSQIRDIDYGEVQIGEYWVSKDRRIHPSGRRGEDMFDDICTEKCCNK